MVTLHILRSMKLIYKPTKLHPEVLKNISADVKKGKYPSDNNAINEILKKHYKVKEKKQTS